MTDHALRVLEFQRVLEYVGGFAISEEGRRAVEGLGPATDPGVVAGELEAVQEVVELLERPEGWPFPALLDVAEPLSLLKVEGSVLAAEELYRVAVLLEAGRAVLSFVSSLDGSAPLLEGSTAEVVADEGLEKSLARAVDGEGNVLDTASRELARLRQRLKGRHGRVVKHLEGVLASLDPTHRVQDASVTIREGRYVIPLRREGKRTVGGYVHDESASGATVFIEPPSAIELMNEIRGLEREEAREVQRILRELTDACRTLAPALEVSLQVLVALDSRRARAAAARAWDGSKPDVTDDGMVLNGGRHPILVISGGPVVPFDLELEPGERVVLVSGPNTGGKTVFLKAVGLIAVLAQAGIIPPVGPGCRLPVFRRFYADVGDEQSLAQSLSTFSAHLKNLREILEGAGPDSLVLVDELGTGTDPKEGEALSRAVVEAISESGCTAIVTSHLGGLRRLATEGGPLVNASLHFDSERLVPTYRFTKGRPGRSFGLAIARGLSFPAEVLDRAETYRDETEARLDDVLQNLEAREQEAGELAAALAVEQERVAVLRAELEVRASSLEAEEKEQGSRAKTRARKMLLDARREVEGAIARLEESVASGVPLGEAAREARRSVEAAARGLEEAPSVVEGPAQPPSGPLEPGLRVRLSDSGANGTVLEMDGGRVVVEVAGLRMRVPPESLLVLDDQTKPAPKSTPSPRWSLDVNPSTEVDLRGQRADEAEAALVKALDEAFLADLTELRIIHGKGTGALRERVTRVLEDDRRIEEFRPGGPGEGGHGVTVVRVR